ncbi:hypothetical protein HPB48_009631 [Haemaphysalis longicornis]|uniref:Uncharacterized protein n=1 Tax=Haemaphysalis longicornis TaxID=44386 RepID=A0A9J6GC29_HAELO|nr:hypothetical protein HPB48_009631 [Haemaphysalis longicornis]
MYSQPPSPSLRVQDYVNTYGSLAAFIVGSFFRAGGGEKVMHIPAFIRYPYYDEKEDAQRFPFRTFSMIMSFCTLLSVSVLAKWLILDVLSPSADIFKCFVEKAEPLAESRPQNATATRESAISNSQVLNTSARSNSGIKSGKAVSAETMSSGRSAELGSKGENRRSKGENRGSKGGNRGSKGDIRGSKGEKRGSGLSATSEEDRRRPKRRPSSSSRESHKGGRRKKEESRETVTATATEESSTSAAPAARKKSRKGKAT